LGRPGFSCRCQKYKEVEEVIKDAEEERTLPCFFKRKKNGGLENWRKVHGSQGDWKWAKPPSLVAGGAGTRWWFRFEPGTPRSSAVCSPRLSYRP